MSDTNNPEEKVYNYGFNSNNNNNNHNSCDENEDTGAESSNQKFKKKNGNGGQTGGASGFFKKTNQSTNSDKDLNRLRKKGFPPTKKVNNSQSQNRFGGNNNYNNNQGGYGGYERKYPKIHTSLANDGIRRLINLGFGQNVMEYEDTHGIMQEKEVIVQVILIKYLDENKNMKARLMISDGVWAVMAVISQDIYNKMDGKEIKQFDVIKVSKCVTRTYDSDQDQLVLVITHPPSVVYQNLKSRIGHPKEMTKSQSQSQKDNVQVSIKIPYQVIIANMNVQEHELIYQDGGTLPISKLNPYMGGRWRIKA